MKKLSGCILGFTCLGLELEADLGGDLRRIFRLAGSGRISADSTALQFKLAVRPIRLGVKGILSELMELEGLMGDSEREQD